MGTSNYSATSNNVKLIHWPLMGELYTLVQRGGNWAGPLFDVDCLRNNTRQT